jgi:hypothetical protein
MERHEGIASSLLNLFFVLQHEYTCEELSSFFACSLAIRLQD